MKTKPVPITIVLMAAAAACVISVIQGVEFTVFFKRLLITVIVFAIIGSITKMVLDFVFNKKVPQPEADTAAETEENQEELENIETEDIGGDISGGEGTPYYAQEGEEETS